MQIANNTLCHNHNQDLKNSSFLNFPENVQFQKVSTPHPHRRDWKFLVGWWVGRIKALKNSKKYMKLYSFQRGGGGRVFSGKFLQMGVGWGWLKDSFWNYTIKQLGNHHVKVFLLCLFWKVNYSLGTTFFCWDIMVLTVFLRPSKGHLWLV